MWAGLTCEQGLSRSCLDRSLSWKWTEGRKFNCQKERRQAHDIEELGLHRLNKGVVGQKRFDTRAETSRRIRAFASKKAGSNEEAHTPGIDPLRW